MARRGVDIQGGMSPQFISKIARSARVNRELESTANSVKAKLEAKAKAHTKGRGRYRYHYGMRRLGGSFGWGPTFVIWASTDVARKNPNWFRAAISSARNIFKK